MIKKGHRYVYMEATPGAAGGGAAAAPAAGAAPAGAPPAAAAAAPTASAPAVPAGSAVPGATPGAAAPSPAGGSALAAGGAGDGAEPGNGASSTAPFSERVPEKFRVKKEDGTLDIEATAAKVEEHRASLERRMGEGGIRPKTAAEYKLPDLPEGLKGMSIDDTSTTKFREDAHAMGLSQAQFEGVMAKYYEMAPMLVNAGQQHSMETTVDSLKKAWGTDYEANAQAAWRGTTAIAKAAGLSVQEVESELGNSPAFNRIMAAVGAQLKEDTPINPGGQGASAGSKDSELATIQASEAYRNPRHPGHAEANAKWMRLATAGVPNTPVV